MEIEQQYTLPEPGPNIQGNLNFGPYVAYFKIPQSFREGLLRKGNLAEPKTANKKLAGLIGDQRNYSIEDREWFVKQFQPYIETYVKGQCRYNAINFDENNHSTSFSLMNLWINYMKGGEFNPEHTHSGQVTWVIYLKTPDLRKEQEEFGGTGLGPGSIGFHYGEHMVSDWAQHTYKYTPEVDGMWIFPAQLRHRVNPFYTKDAERISVSGNLFFNRPNTPSLAEPQQTPPPGWSE